MRRVKRERVQIVKRVNEESERREVVGSEESEEKRVKGVKRVSEE
jgi:hypothetical protein